MTNEKLIKKKSMRWRRRTRTRRRNDKSQLRKSRTWKGIREDEREEIHVCLLGIIQKGKMRDDLKPQFTEIRRNTLE